MNFSPHRPDCTSLRSHARSPKSQPIQASTTTLVFPDSPGSAGLWPAGERGILPRQALPVGHLRQPEAAGTSSRVTLSAAGSCRNQQAGSLRYEFRVATLLLLLAWLGLGGFGARAAEPTLAEVGRALAQADSVVTGFVQERHLSLFDEPLRSEGWLCFKRPGNIRWEVTKPYQSILISDGSGVAQFEWVDERWKKLDIALAGAMQNVVSQIAGVMEGRYASGSKDYAVSLTNSAAGPIIQLVPQHEAMRKMMQAIEVHLAPDLKQTIRVVLRETGGDFTDIRFTNQTVGVSLPAKVFDRAQPAPLKEIQAAATGIKP